MSEHWTIEEFREYQKSGRTPNHNRTTNSVADLERIARDERLAANESQAFSSPVRIGIISHRKRLTDADGVSAKAAIDGLVQSGLLADDSPEHVREVWYKQTKSKVEKTQIVIEELE